MAEGDPTTDDGTPPVVLCCATPDEATARSAADALLSRGHQVELVIGVEEEHAELEAAIKRCEAQGLYVLCRSSALPRSTIDELRAVLRSHEVPFGRTLTLAVEAKRPRALEERIVSVLKRMVTGKPDKGGSKRPTVSYSAPAPVSRPPAPGGIGAPPEHGVDASSEAPDAVDADEIDAWADSLVGPVPTDPAAKTAVEPGGVAKSDPRTFTAPAPDYQPALTTQVAPETPPKDETPVRDGNTVKQKVLDMPRTEPPPVAPLPSPPSASPRAQAAAAASNPNLGAPSSLSGGVLGGPPTPDDEDLDSAITVGGPLTRALGGPRGLMLVLGGVAALIVVFAIVVFATRDDDPADKIASKDKKDKKSDTAKADAKKAGADGNADEAKADDGKADDAAADDGAAIDDAAADDVVADDGAADDAVADDGAPDDGADAAADDGAGDGAGDGVGPAGDDGSDPIAAAAPPREPPDAEHYEAPAEPPPPPTDPVAVGAGDAPEVVAALRSREVRALDLFVVAPEDSDNMNHTSAVAYCEAMRVAGLTGWRVPKLGELNSIVAAGMTGKGIYWSDTLGDAFGDTRIIVNAKRDRMGAATIGFEGARVLCIRDRR